MSDDKDNSQLIKDFLELWQKQFPYETFGSESIADIDVFDKIKESCLNFSNNFNLQNNHHEQSPTTNANPDMGFDDDIRKLKQRIVELEERLAKVEGKP